MVFPKVGIMPIVLQNISFLIAVFLFIQRQFKIRTLSETALDFLEYMKAHHVLCVCRYGQLFEVEWV
jgi:hypothetical protein